MDTKAKIIIEGKTYEYPIVTGTEGEKAIDISALRKDSGYITLDVGYANTGSCTSNITFLDGEKGILRYRGIPIEDLSDTASFVEICFLLIYGHLPTKIELEKYSEAFTKQSMIHEGMKSFFDGYPLTGHPMGILSAMIGSMAGYYPELIKPNPSKEEIDLISVELLSKVRTIAAFAYKKSIGEPYVYPRHDLKYVPNFLNMMFNSPTKPYEIKPVIVNALRTFLVLHADHEQNCSTSTVRLVGSGLANLFASVSAGVNALWGSLHGGANQAVIEMLQKIQTEGGDIKKYVDMAKDKNSKFRLMGFGHRVYKNYDPRAKILKSRADDLFRELNISDPLLDLAKKLEDIALKDSYFIERKLYPNVDFYSGIILRTIGIPLNMFPVMFAIGRMPGWIAHWKEMLEGAEVKIGRPRQIYTGNNVRKFIPIEQR
ncbi:MAG: citrate synthase [Candidatus Omnitrophica bacterium]|nr:citrate synthase [Candidatus Omnitrophota bacterium]